MFDGVGGFPLGLRNVGPDVFETAYINQFEPSTKSQEAYDIGCYRFPDAIHIPEDVEKIPDTTFEKMKLDGVNMIVGGFPCQDYSVARSKTNELGIQGKKGVLFWQIVRVVKIIEPKYVLLENVDRLLKAPSKNKGRDFAIMLSSFNELGYCVEWKVINAADYGFPQKRKRVFIVAYKSQSNDEDLEKRVKENSLFSHEFPSVQTDPKKMRIGLLGESIAETSETYNDGSFYNSGIMENGKYYTTDMESIWSGQMSTLGDVIQPLEDINDSLFLTPEQEEKFKYLRGGKKIVRKSKTGHEYIYAEGAMSPYDGLEKPSRTMLTSEGTTNRSTHILKQNGRLRFLTEIEAERLQDFPDDWTRFRVDEKTGEIIEVSRRKRLFFMGNALVVGVVTMIGNCIVLLDEDEQN